MTPQEIINKANSIEGWFQIQDMQAIINVIQSFNNNPIKYLELGSSRGRSTISIGLSLPPYSEYLGIDRFMPEKGHVEPLMVWDDNWERMINKEVHDEYLRNLEYLRKENPTCKFDNLVLDTIDAVDKVKDNYYDILFIDADHSFEGVKRDLINYYPKVKETGIIAGHDYFAGFPGIIKCVNMFCKGKQITGSFGGCVWYVKKSDIDKKMIPRKKR